MNAENFKIIMPSPCEQNWDNMLPQGNGRYCGSCQKTVVDFTNYTDEELKFYFLQNAYSKTCGRFKENQLYRIKLELPEKYIYKPQPKWKRFLLMVLVCFGIQLFSLEIVLQTNQLHAQNNNVNSSLLNDELEKIDLGKQNEIVGTTVSTYSATMEIELGLKDSVNKKANVINLSGRRFKADTINQYILVNKNTLKLNGVKIVMRNPNQYKIDGVIVRENGNSFVVGSIDYIDFELPGRPVSEE